MTLLQKDDILIANAKILDEYRLERKEYIYVTLHRPSNVDDRVKLIEIVDALDYIGSIIGLKIIFPLHPRTRKSLVGFHLLDRCRNIENLITLEPLGYIDSMAITRSAKVVLTDSGGLQEETTYLGVPCLTLRPNTERPITAELGTNFLAGNRKDAILEAYKNAVIKNVKNRKVPPKWDGLAAQRIWKIILHEKDI